MKSIICLLAQMVGSYNLPSQMSMSNENIQRKKAEQSYQKIICFPSVTQWMVCIVMLSYTIEIKLVSFVLSPRRLIIKNRSGICINNKCPMAQTMLKQ